MSSPLAVSDQGGVRTLRLDRPERLNALDSVLRGALADALAQAAADDGTRAVIVTGTGERGFCAGQDLKEGARLGAASGPEWMRSWDAFFNAFLTFPKPIVAAVNGVAAGAGFDLVLFSDVRLAVPEARFMMSEINVGLPTLLGSFLLGQEAFWSRGLEIVLAGGSIAAEDARAIGFVHEVAARDALPARAAARAAELAAKPPVAMRLTIARLREMRLRPMREHGVFEAMRRYQLEAVASGEPQRVMAEFFAARAKAPR